MMAVQLPRPCLDTSLAGGRLGQFCVCYGVRCPETTQFFLIALFEFYEITFFYSKLSILRLDAVRLLNDC